MIIGNKSDQNDDRDISIQTVHEFVNEHELEYHEISAKDKECVDDLFRNAAQRLFKKKMYEESEAILTAQRHTTLGNYNSCCVIL